MSNGKAALAFVSLMLLPVALAYGADAARQPPRHKPRPVRCARTAPVIASAVEAESCNGIPCPQAWFASRAPEKGKCVERLTLVQALCGSHVVRRVAVKYPKARPGTPATAFLEDFVRAKRGTPEREMYLDLCAPDSGDGDEL